MSSKNIKELKLLLKKEFKEPNYLDSDFNVKYNIEGILYKTILWFLVPKFDSYNIE